VIVAAEAVAAPAASDTTPAATARAGRTRVHRRVARPSPGVPAADRPPRRGCQADERAAGSGSRASAARTSRASRRRSAGSGTPAWGSPRSPGRAAHSGRCRSARGPWARGGRAVPTRRAGRARTASRRASRTPWPGVRPPCPRRPRGRRRRPLRRARAGPCGPPGRRPPPTRRGSRRPARARARRARPSPRPRGPARARRGPPAPSGRRASAGRPRRRRGGSASLPPSTPARRAARAPDVQVVRVRRDPVRGEHPAPAVDLVLAGPPRRRLGVRMGVRMAERDEAAGRRLPGAPGGTAARARGG
jgi:hypothetical protein